MAYKGSQPFKITLEAGADLSTKQYYFVKIDSSTGKAVVCSNASDRPVGVLQNNPTSGQAAEITVVGLTKVSSDAGLTIGNLIGTSGDGQADAKTPGTDTSEYVVGTVITSTSNAAEIATVMVNCANPHRAA